MTPPQKKTVLVVDDSSTIRNIIQKILENLGFDVFLAVDGLDALEKLPKVNPDLITSDVDMPSMDGYEFCKRIREGETEELSQFSDIPIVVVTANDTHGMRENWFKSGATDFIVKPFQAEELETAVMKALGKKENEFAEAKILIAEDSNVIRNLLSSIVQGIGAQVTAVEDGQKAWETLQKDSYYDLVLTDFEMPNMNGLELCKKVRSSGETDKIPLIFLTSVYDQDVILEAYAEGASDYITKPFLKEELVSRLKIHLQNAIQIKEKNKLVARLEEKVVARNKLLLQEQIATILMISNITENRDSDTGKHTQRTQFFVEILIRELSKSSKYKYDLGEDQIIDIVRASPLHDIGKISIPDNILLKPGKLTVEEFDIMKTHAEAGERILSKHDQSSSFFPIAAQIAGYHHEKWDGSGYPRSLKGEEIPLSARVMALADVYDALTMKRVYKEAMSPKEAKAIILEGKGTHFDPQLVDIYLEKEAEFIKISEMYGD